MPGFIGIEVRNIIFLGYFNMQFIIFFTILTDGKTFAKYYNYSFDFISKNSCLKFQLEIDANLKEFYLNLDDELIFSTCHVITWL